MSGGVDPLIRVTVARPDGGEFSALSRRSGQRIELLPADGGLPPLRSGERLGLRRPVADDATYEEPVVVVGPGAADGAVLVEPAGERRRHQQRDHVRVATPALDMRLREVLDEATEADGADDPPTPRELVARVVDLSAGGARIEHDGPPLRPGTRWTLRTVLAYDDGSELVLDQVGEVRWGFDPAAARAAFADTVDESDGDDGDDGDDDVPTATAGLHFVEVRPGDEEAITRWVFQQQAKWLRVRRRG